MSSQVLMPKKAHSLSSLNYANTCHCNGKCELSLSTAPLFTPQAQDMLWILQTRLWKGNFITLSSCIQEMLIFRQWQFEYTELLCLTFSFCFQVGWEETVRLICYILSSTSVCIYVFSLNWLDRTPMCMSASRREGKLKMKVYIWPSVVSTLSSLSCANTKFRLVMEA